MKLGSEAAIWASLILNMIPIAVLWVLSGLMRRLNALHDERLHDIKLRIEAIDKKFDAKWDEHFKMHMHKGK